jgi:N-acetylneuraminic acid mutarotase
MKKALQILLIISSISLLNTADSFSQESLWQKLATLDNAPGLPVLATVNGKLYVLSGTSNANSPTYEYDPATDKWTAKAPIPQGCFWASAQAVDGKIYVMGGRHPSPPQNYNYIYDPVEDKWTKGADLLTPRSYHNAVQLNGKIYIMGGQNGDGTTEWYFDEYNPAEDKWKREAQLPHSGAWYCGAAALDGKIYRIAGGGSSLTLAKDWFDMYDPETDKWTELPPFRIKLHAPAAVTYKDKIYLMGGYTNNVEIDTIYQYTTESATWMKASLKLPQPRTYHKAIVIDKCIYVFGGQNSSEDFKGQLYRFCFAPQDAEENSFESNNTVTPNPSQGDFHISLQDNTLLPDYISVNDIYGREVRFEYTTDIIGLHFSLKERAAGMYFVHFNINDNSTCKKVVVE